ncbi:MAG: sulfur carrier protein ThiS [Candidatus Saganbacteria bacterium]|nr:sulfur carrier protein ThiS [Candidatus Saganbacteria bacterium]
MQITLNGEIIQIEDGIILLHYLKSKKINPATVAVELNQDVIDKKNYPNVIIKDGDKLEIVKFMGGGQYNER